MTRLKEDDIEGISATLLNYDQELLIKTGFNLRELAAFAAGVDIDMDNYKSLQVAVVPMTCGQGIIGGFAESVSKILTHLGFKAWVTKLPDVGGVAESVKNNADIVFMADDQRFMAINLRTRVVSDNGSATGKGYAAGLDRMCGGLAEKEVLVLGAGPVGTSAAVSLTRYKARITIFDLDITKSWSLQEKCREAGYLVKVENDLNLALQHHNLIVDACPAENVILQVYLREDTMIAAPGIPLGIEPACIEQISPRLLHDPLQIGVAVMMFEVLK